MSLPFLKPVLLFQQCERLAARNTAPRTLRQPNLQCVHLRRRNLSTTPTRYASQANRAVKPTGGSKNRPPSMSVQMKEQREKAMRSGDLPDDVGLLDDTFVMPRLGSKNLPSVIGHSKDRLRMHRRHLWLRAKEIFSALNAWWVTPRPRKELELRKMLDIPSIAKDLHREMYTAFAAGHLEAVEKTICSGMLYSLRSRIAARAPGTSMRWTLHKHVSKPKLMSYKVARIPTPKNAEKMGMNAYLQAVVRIRSIQSIKHVRLDKVRDGTAFVTKEVVVDAQGREVRQDWASEDEIPPNAKESTEFLVVQRMVVFGKPGPWKVWGTTEEMTVERMKTDAMKKKATEDAMLASKG